MNGYHALLQFYRKTFLQSVDPKQLKNFKFSLWSIIEIFPRGGAVHDFSGEVQKFSGEVRTFPYLYPQNIGHA
jgi:hypothetical protein